MSNIHSSELEQLLDTSTRDTLQTGMLAELKELAEDAVIIEEPSTPHKPDIEVVTPQDGDIVIEAIDEVLAESTEPQIIGLTPVERAEYEKKLYGDLMRQLIPQPGDVKTVDGIEYLVGNDGSWMKTARATLSRGGEKKMKQRINARAARSGGKAIHKNNSRKSAKRIKQRLSDNS